jgi:hypothetical protein
VLVEHAGLVRRCKDLVVVYDVITRGSMRLRFASRPSSRALAVPLPEIPHDLGIR